MARGILQGQYLRQFGGDVYADFFAALIAAINGKSEQAIDRLEKLGATLIKQDPYDEAIIYAVHANLALLYQHAGVPARAAKQWKSLANWGQKHSPLLFRRARLQLIPNDKQKPAQAFALPMVANVSLGDRITKEPTDAQYKVSDEFLYEGSRMQLFRLTDGGRVVVNSQRKVVAAWQSGGKVRTVKGLAVGDDAPTVLQRLDVPSRVVYTTRGDYLAYDNLGLAVLLQQGQVGGWFAYRPR
jgi:hypothetical protein